MKAVLSAGALAFASFASAKVLPRQSQGNLPPIVSEGNAFWTESGERFYIRGVAYQPGGAADAQDPLLNLEQFREDVEAFKDLGINTIRIYTVDNSGDHDEAMKLLDDAGIYLALDVNTPKASLNRENIDSLHASYNDVYLQSVFATIDTFSKYSMYSLGLPCPSQNTNSIQTTSLPSSPQTRSSTPATTPTLPHTSRL